ncbi:MAG: hypothetical protein LBG58_05415 [Planctomycetaceae bacterium]|jgi:hypothetical protein|nr:hypothetical protein [Planctomycetaceae bacterium]
MKTKRETRLERKLASGEQLLKKTKEKAKRRLDVEKEKSKQRLDVEKQKHKTTKEGLKQLKHENRRLTRSSGENWSNFDVTPYKLSR